MALLSIDEEHDHVDTDLLPVDINPEILDGWCYVGIAGYWYIYGLLPKQADRIKLDIHTTLIKLYSHPLLYQSRIEYEELFRGRALIKLLAQYL